MRIKLDENIPVGLSAVLASLGHDVDTVQDENLTGRDDEAVWKAAQDSGRFFLTQDLDFSDTRKFKPGTHCGVLVIRLIQPGIRTLIQLVESMFTSEDVENWRDCFVVVTEHKLRIKKPEKSS
ncbi:MAG: DUF5615 family PIN-like protein [Armatimonadota bacterium]